MPQCKFCQQEFGLAGLRLDGCWDCATAESVIEDGFDMREKGPDGTSTPAESAGQKLRFLIALGWTKGPRPSASLRTAEGEEI